MSDRLDKVLLIVIAIIGVILLITVLRIPRFSYGYGLPQYQTASAYMPYQTASVEPAQAYPKTYSSATSYRYTDTPVTYQTYTSYQNLEPQVYSYQTVSYPGGSYQDRYQYYLTQYMNQPYSYSNYPYTYPNYGSYYPSHCSQSYPYTCW